jgi:hypothetical protein
MGVREAWIASGGHWFDPLPHVVRFLVSVRQSMDKVKVRINSGRGLVGEDRTDWLPGEVHEASKNYAQHLVHNGAAEFVTDDDRAETPAIESRDPMPESHDPVPEHRDPVIARGRKR